MVALDPASSPPVHNVASERPDWDPDTEMYVHSHYSEPGDGLEKEGLESLSTQTFTVVRMLMDGTRSPEQLFAAVDKLQAADLKASSE